jgi:hypothetical protein
MEGSSSSYVIEEPVAPCVSAPAPQVRRRAPRKCSVCQKPGHNKNHCPERACASSNLDVGGDFDDDADLEANVDEEADVDGEDGDEEDIGDGFPPQMICQTEGEWENKICPMEERDEGGGVPQYPNLDAMLPPFNPQHQPGKKCIHPRIKTPVQFFSLLMTDDIMTVFVAATNMEAAITGRKRGWPKPVDITEFKTFLGLLLMFGLIAVPEDNAAFDVESMYHVPFMSKRMTVSRFRAIVACWKWDASVHRTAADRVAANKADSFWSVRGFVEAVVPNFEKYYQAYQNISLDEACIAFKGRHMDRQYNGSKPNKWHFRLYMLNCANTGYCLDTFLYQLRDPKRTDATADYPADMTSTSYPIIRLVVKNPTYHNCGHVLYVDNWYTSIPVALHCRDKGIHFIGTVQSNRKGLAKNGLQRKSSNTPRGSVKQMGMICDLPSGRLCDLYMVGWYDRKPVHLLSTLKSNLFCVSRKVKDPVRGFEKKRVRAPTVIYHYNKGMGGTDLCDQNLSYYRNAMRTKKWQPRVFLHLVQLCAFNAHILYKQHFNLQRGHRGYRLKNFLEELVRGLFGEGRCVTHLTQMADEDEDGTPIPAVAINNARRKREEDHGEVEGEVTVRKHIRLAGALELQPHVTDHHPVKWSSRAQGAEINKTDKRPHCKMCYARCSYSCKCCRVGLCLDIRVGNVSCWELFHTA